jgi:SAM-dependent methyltransferase
MPKLPLSRFLQPSDVASLSDRLQALVEDRFAARSPQHTARKIEYTTVLEALEQMSLERPLKEVIDIGGAGSPLPLMVQDTLGLRYPPPVIDPEIGNGTDLHGYLQLNPRLCDVVLCISVIEHVKDEHQFLYDLSQLVAPGGWLILTMDAVNQGSGTPDTYHFHWMRERIYGYNDRERVRNTLRLWNLHLWGPSGCQLVSDVAPTEPLVHDYSFFSLVFQKGVRP